MKIQQTIEVHDVVSEWKKMVGLIQAPNSLHNWKKWAQMVSQSNSCWYYTLDVIQVTGASN
jgi:hypothetical protein